MASSSIEDTNNGNEKVQQVTSEIIESMKTENIEEQRKEFMDYVAAHGVSGYEQFLDEHLNQWMKYPLRIAVTGSSGQGKSSLINTLRGLKPKSPGAARVGVVECTNKVTEYPDPKHPNLIYYDLPGVGTPSYPRDQYFKIIKSQTTDNIEIHDFDFFLIVSAGRFTENDLWLTEQIQQIGKRFYFLRTKIDFDLRNDFEDDPDAHDELAVLAVIRENCFAELKKIDANVSHEDKVFLISTKLGNSEKWDFPKMVKSLLRDYPILKRNAIIMSITVNCKEVIRAKAEVLRNQIWKASVGASVIGALPVTGASMIGGGYILTAMLAYYKQCLGLDTGSLDTLANAHGLATDQILEQLYNTQWTKYFIAGQTALVILEEGAEEVFKTMAKEVTRLFPIVGALLGGGVAFVTMSNQLHDLLNNLEKAALFVLDYVTTESKQHRQ